VRPPKSQFTLSELMALVALCAVGFALLTTSVAPLGAGVLVVAPGFVLDRARGGNGILGGTVSGCLIPMALTSIWAALEYLTGYRTLGQSLDFFPALYLLFVVCLTWSSFASCLLYLLDRRLQGPQRSNRLATTDDPGIRFLPDDDRPGRVSQASPGLAGLTRASNGASDR
jgi:hypothetical protein